jgi:ketosteroid isomerase-like protein
MKNVLFLSVMLCSFLYTACGPVQDDGQPLPDNAEQSLREANDQFYAALNAMFVGEIEPMNAIWSHDEGVTLMSPFGGRKVGWEAVGGEFRNNAEMKLGGKVECQELAVYAGTHLGYTLCVESGENMTADGKPVPVSFRATNIFRIEKGQWKMVHHHTDISTPLQDAILKKE